MSVRDMYGLPALVEVREAAFNEALADVLTTACTDELTEIFVDLGCYAFLKATLK